ncbi:hypothetical protein HMPREF0765_1157 [Sphingobacterium spiritivorum ATCC 33300]|uniref:Bulb-type lectin domain-containing protein n=2 Tax=Sphingobacterium spiritivorum TaxID=258 RepID=C2FV01_SPHSI|nr:hypothetical protein HMPREF0765_1157 [Sphingobacterium spiritivorum ATCC 33300]
MIVIMKIKKLTIALLGMSLLASCKNEVVKPTEDVKNVDDQEILKLKNFYGKIANIPTDSVVYNADKDYFVIAGRESIESGEELAVAFMQAQSFSAASNNLYPPGHPQYAGYPTSWYYNFVFKKKQPATVINTEYYSGSTIKAGATLMFPFTLTSPNRQFSLLAQVDGNLVIRNNGNGKILWDSGSYRKYGTREIYQIRFQNDGNLVIYSNKDGIFGDVVWATNNLFVPGGDPGFALIRTNARYVLQDDGNLVLYFAINSSFTPTRDIIAQPIAETNTWGGRVSTQWNQIK